jgi:hypothetical protein
MLSVKRRIKKAVQFNGCEETIGDGGELFFKCIIDYMTSGIYNCEAHPLSCLFRFLSLSRLIDSFASSPSPRIYNRKHYTVLSRERAPHKISQDIAVADIGSLVFGYGRSPKRSVTIEVPALYIPFCSTSWTFQGCPSGAVCQSCSNLAQPPDGSSLSFSSCTTRS